MQCFNWRKWIITLGIMTMCTALSHIAIAQDYKKSISSIDTQALKHPEYLDTLDNITYRNFHLDYNYFDSIATYIQVTSEKIRYHNGIVNGLLLRILIAESKGTLPVAKVLLDEVSALIDTNQQTASLALYYICQANYLRRKKQTKLAYEYLIKSIDISSAVGDKSLQAMAHTTLGIIHVGRKEYDKALAYYENSMLLAVEIQDFRRIQRSYTNQGIVYMRQQQFEKSISAHHAALKIAIDQGNDRDAAFSYNDLGAAFLISRKNIPLAIEYLQKSIAIRERINEDAEIAYTYNYLGQAYDALGKQSLAATYYDKGLQTATKIGNEKQKLESLQLLAYHYKSTGDMTSAFEYIYAYNVLQDSIRTIEQQDAIDELTIRYETHQKEQEIQLLSQQNNIQQLHLQRRNIYLIITITFALLTVALLFLLYLNKKIKVQSLEQAAIHQAAHHQLTAQNTLQQDRLRISKELHDNIGANLTFLHSSLDELKSDNPAWSHVNSILQETMQELRRSVWLINKPEVTIEEWTLKITEYFSKLKSVTVRNQISNPSIKLHATEATALYRILQEATNNAIKHAAASHIIISITEVENTLDISIQDDGIGFLENALATKGFGLQNMRHHATTIGADLNIRSNNSYGTVIQVKYKVHPITT